jgi:drug/metabolite transporter (DMT)-like permease
MLLGLAAAVAAAVVFGGASILQAIGSRRVSSSSGFGLATVGQLLRQPPFVAAVLLNLLGFVLHLVAVRTLPLFLAQAGIAASLAVTALLAVRVFHDKLGATEWSAVASVCLGLALLTAAAGETGETRATATSSAALFAVAAVMVVGGLVATRGRGVSTAVVLSLLAGLGFATSAVASRLLPELTFTSVLGSPVTYALGLSGGLAFLLYSLALQRSSITVATAPMIVLQTAAPAVVGVALLGDEVRSGWAAAALVGSILTAAGGVALVHYEGLREQAR